MTGASYEVTTRMVQSRHLAVVRDRRGWGDLGAALIPLLDRVYVAVRAAAVTQSGHNVFVFREPSREGVTVEVGVEVSSSFAPKDGIDAVATPAGEAAFTLHKGPYSGLGAAHEAVLDWCRQQGRRHAGVFWEVYGDWREDPAQLETEVYYALHPREE